MADDQEGNGGGLEATYRRLTALSPEFPGLHPSGLFRDLTPPRPASRPALQYGLASCAIRAPPSAPPASPAVQKYRSCTFPVDLVDLSVYSLNP
jgi:hypothetical protein